MRTLMTAEKCKQAVELAKEHHKRLHSAASEQLLVDAYISRIEQFQSKNAPENALVVINIVKERFPAHMHRLKLLEVRANATGGSMEQLIAPLARGDVDPGIKTSIESAITAHITDLATLANCAAVPVDHPLRAAAKAIHAAFTAVTTGPVTNEQIALPEVSRHSPLAAWKTLIRAMAAFYHGDDALCRRLIATIPPHAAVARAGEALLAMLDHRDVPQGMTKIIAGRISGSDAGLRSALQNVEAALVGFHVNRLKKSVADAVRACRSVRPDILDKVAAHLICRAILTEAPVDPVMEVLRVSIRFNAYFWKLRAQANEMVHSPTVGPWWILFLAHAQHEGLMKGNSPEEVQVCLRAAEALAKVDPDELEAARREGPDLAEYMRADYSKQPREIAALVANRPEFETGTVYDPAYWFGRAAAIQPDPETFRQWTNWLDNSGASAKNLDHVARSWHQALPGDVEALLLLLKLAEDRKAFSLALDYLAQAEAVAPMNPLVRQARGRLILLTAWRHFKSKKPHLVEQDLIQFEALPPTMERSLHAGFLAALRIALEILRNDVPAATRFATQCVEAIGAPTAMHLIAAVEAKTNVYLLPAWTLPRTHPEFEPPEAVDIFIKCYQLGKHTGLEMAYPVAVVPPIQTALREKPCRIPRASLFLLAAARIGEATDYLVATAGLAVSQGPEVATFLLCRARAIFSSYPKRATQCLLAALTLARQANDADMAAKATNFINRHGLAQQLLERAGGQGVEPKILAEILTAERAAEEFPRNAAEGQRHVVEALYDWDDGPQWIPSGPDASDDQEDEEDDDDDELGMDFQDDSDGKTPGLFDQDSDTLRDNLEIAQGLPEPLRGLFIKLLNKYGRLPTEEELLREGPDVLGRLVEIAEQLSKSDPSGGPRRGKKHKRRRR